MSWKISGPMGVLPDLVAFVPSSIYAFVSGIPRVNIDDNTRTEDIPIAWDIYQWSHSFTIVLILFISAWWILERRGHQNAKQTAWIFVIPWIAHIILDIPGHTINFFPTPFLYPFSDLMFDGVRWSTWWFFTINLVLLLGTWYWVLKNERDQSISETADTADLA
jgi:membrane-bound metal-dependent hydrolase YbcI (DUF457 family)